MNDFDWNIDCAYNADRKALFHRVAKARLRLLAKKLNFDAQDYDIRSNQGGIAVSGEAILHHIGVYIVVSLGSPGIMIRKCNGRRDFSGGPNTWLPLTELDGDLSKLADHVEKILHASYPSHVLKA